MAISFLYGISETEKPTICKDFGRYLHSSHHAPFMKHQTYNIERPLAWPRVQAQMSNKHNLVLYIDRELVEKTRNLGFNLSKTFENHLKQLITQFSQVNQLNNCESNVTHSDWWAGPDLNRRPLARKANVLTKLDDRPSPFGHCAKI